MSKWFGTSAEDSTRSLGQAPSTLQFFSLFATFGKTLEEHSHYTVNIWKNGAKKEEHKP